jgi:hypothetical protein
MEGLIKKYIKPQFIVVPRNLGVEMSNPVISE